MQEVKIRSLAKVNLDLRILNRREDGFHELRTVFQTISLADTIHIRFEKSRKTELTLDGNVDIPNNLILRAAAAVLDSLRVHAKVHFKLEKRIPMGAGLGGGSSNAAAVLMALNTLAGAKSKHQAPLEEIGASLGSDVPFFLLGGTAVGVGRGTEFYGIPDILEQEVLVVSPDVHVATGPAYQALGRGLTFIELSSSIKSFQGFVRALGESRRADLAGAQSENDFESVVFRQYPQLKTTLGKLSGIVGSSGTARMTGSGSSLFGIFESKEDRERARKVLEGDRVLRGCRLIPARLVSRQSYRRLWTRQLASTQH